jgi:hypothetical protein
MDVPETIGRLSRARRRERGNVDRALREVAERVQAKRKHDRDYYEYVRDIHYDPDPDWRRAVAVEWTWRKT